jgi:hypothetical protein
LWPISVRLIQTTQEYNRDVLGVSKRCCPACDRLVNLIRSEQAFNEKLITPGNHTKWSGVALPPWLHSKYAIPIVYHAKKVLRYRFELLLQEAGIQNDLRLIKDGVSPVSPTPESPADQDELISPVSDVDMISMQVFTRSGPPNQDGRAKRRKIDNDET